VELLFLHSPLVSSGCQSTAGELLERDDVLRRYKPPHKRSTTLPCRSSSVTFWCLVIFEQSRRLARATPASWSQTVAVWILGGYPSEFLKIQN
jgi:hypothetical protein